MCWGDVQFRTKNTMIFCFKDINTPLYITSIWKSKCMMRHKVFAWLMLVDRLNTKDMLCRRHFDIGEDHSCMLCPTGALETSTHLFFECQFSLDCWQIVHMAWNTDREMQIMFDTASRNWPHNKVLFKEISILAAWNIWKIRNRCHFDGVPALLQDWLRMVKDDFEILKLRLKTELADYLSGFSASLVL